MSFPVGNCLSVADRAGCHARIKRVGDRGSGMPIENHKNIGFLRKTDPDPLKKHKAFKASIKCWAIIGTPAKWRFAGGSIIAR